MSWLRHERGYDLFFNRDESRARKFAEPPAIHRSGQLAFIAPSDGNHGGTWIAVNAAGIALCLLNGYHQDDSTHGEQAPEDRISRGLLVTSLADARSPAEAVERTAAAHLERFASFRLAVFHPTLAPRYARWQSGDLQVGLLTPTDMPVVSSSFRPSEVTEARRQAFRSLVADSGDESVTAHLAFHRSHAGETGAHSVCMHRPDAKTVSFSRISVDEAQVQFFYAPHSPHEGTSDMTAQVLERS